MGLQIQKQTTRPRGFTLVELLLTLSLILLLAGAVIFNFSSLHQGSQLDEGATQLEALFRLARAEASSSGHTVRVILARPDPANPSNPSNLTNAPAPATDSFGGIDLHWETDPWGAPGRFEPVPAAAPLVEQINELIRILPPESASTDAALPAFPAGSLPAESETPGDAPRAPVTFYPDGSSDNVEVVLMARNEEDPRRMVVRLSGTTGTLRRRWLGLPGGETPQTDPVPPDPVDPVTGHPAK